MSRYCGHPKKQPFVQFEFLGMIPIPVCRRDREYIAVAWRGLCIDVFFRKKKPTSQCEICALLLRGAYAFHRIRDEDLVENKTVLPDLPSTATSLASLCADFDATVSVAPPIQITRSSVVDVVAVVAAITEEKPQTKSRLNLADWIKDNAPDVYYVSAEGFFCRACKRTIFDPLHVYISTLGVSTDLEQSSLMLFCSSFNLREACRCCGTWLTILGLRVCVCVLIVLLCVCVSLCVSRLLASFHLKFIERQFMHPAP